MTDQPGRVLMRLRSQTGRLWIVLSVIPMVGAKPGAGSLPPGRQHRLTIAGDNTVTFVPQTGLAPLPIDYRADIEYLVNTRSANELVTRGASTAKKKTGLGSLGATDRVKKKTGGKAAAKVAGAVDLAIHSAEMKLRHHDQMVVETRISRSRFQGRLLPNAPVLNVSDRE